MISRHPLDAGSGLLALAWGADFDSVMAGIQTR
jgi:hypothetical protein